MVSSNCSGNIAARGKNEKAIILNGSLCHGKNPDKIQTPSAVLEFHLETAWDSVYAKTNQRDCLRVLHSKAPLLSVRMDSSKVPKAGFAAFLHSGPP